MVFEARSGMVYETRKPGSRHQCAGDRQRYETRRMRFWGSRWIFSAAQQKTRYSAPSLRVYRRESGKMERDKGGGKRVCICVCVCMCEQMNLQCWMYFLINQPEGRRSMFLQSLGGVLRKGPIRGAAFGPVAEAWEYTSIGSQVILINNFYCSLALSSNMMSFSDMDWITCKLFWTWRHTQDGYKYEMMIELIPPPSHRCFRF